MEIPGPHDRLGDAKVPLLEPSISSSHRAVPQNGSGIDDFLRVDIRGLGTSTLPIILDILDDLDLS